MASLTEQLDAAPSAPENPAAFPSVCLGDPGHPSSAPGMTLRDYFAAQALGRLTSNDDTRARASWTVNPEADLATWAYRIADAMLVARVSS